MNSFYIAIVRPSNETADDEAEMLDIDRRTLLKLTGGTAIAGGVTAGMAGTAAAAQGTTSVEIEGVFDSVDSTNRTISVLGITVDVATDAVITSPTSTLTFDQLASASFPGRTESGFIGGTAVPVGTATYDTDAGTLSVTASNLFVEVAEHVIVGVVTKNTVDTAQLDDPTRTGELRVNGVLVEPVGDDRMPLVAVLEDLGTEVDVSQIPEGSTAAVEGYIGNDGVLYTHTLEASQGDVVGDPVITIDRAQCQTGNTRLRVRGFSSETSGSVKIYDGGTDGLLGETQLQPSDVELQGEYNFDERDLPGECPSSLRVELEQNGTVVALAVSSVDVK